VTATATATAAAAAAAATAAVAVVAVVAAVVAEGRRRRMVGSIRVHEAWRCRWEEYSGISSISFSCR
jgi:hypothetical protein